MKKIFLTGKQIRILLKIESFGFPFFARVSDFLEENQDVSDELIVEQQFTKDECDDIHEMVEGCMSEQEFAELQKITQQLK
jgi:hypothetical protein